MSREPAKRDSPLDAGHVLSHGPGKPEGKPNEPEGRSVGLMDDGCDGVARVRPTSQPDSGFCHTGSGRCPSLFCSSPDSFCDAFQGGERIRASIVPINVNRMRM